MFLMFVLPFFDVFDCVLFGKTHIFPPHFSFEPPQVFLAFPPGTPGVIGGCSETRSADVPALRGSAERCRWEVGKWLL